MCIIRHISKFDSFTGIFPDKSGNKICIFAQTDKSNPSFLTVEGLLLLVYVLIMHGWAKTSSESAASNKLSTRQPPAPIFLSDLDNRTDRHIQVVVRNL